MAESKVDNIEEDWAYINSIKNKGDIFNAYLTSIKNKYDTVDKVEKSGTNLVSNRPNKIIPLEKIPKTPEVIIPKDNLDVSVFTRLWSSLVSVAPEQKIIPRKNNSK